MDGDWLDYDVGIVGAGFGGLIAGLELLRSRRRSFAIFERAPEVGGVWRDNAYPGCATDVRSQLYAIERYPNPDWTTVYAGQAEILAYLKMVAREGGLEPHLRFGAEVVEARFIDARSYWSLRFLDGSTLRVGMLILATGPQSRPNVPSLPGLESFAGGVNHSSRWDRDFNPSGQRIAVIGTGASAVQIVPRLVDQTAHLTVFQRSAPWILPRGDRHFTRLERWLFRHVPGAHALRRSAIYWLMEIVGSAFFTGALAQSVLQSLARRHLRRQVRDPATREALAPDHVLGCKRVLISDDFYPAFNRPDVSLVTASIQRVEPRGIRTADDVLHAVDHIVLATGFTVAEATGFLRIIGRHGILLEEAWADGPVAYLGISVAGFPNLAFLLGPNSGLGHSSAIHVIESQMSYVLQYLAAREAMGPGTAFDVRPEVQAAYNREIQDRLARTVWASGCRSWYLTASGRNTTIFPGLTHEYRRLTARFDRHSYRS